MINKVKNTLFFETKTVRGKILKNFIWLITGNTGSRLLKSLIVIYAARKLGVNGYGIFSYALSLAGFFVFFKNVGVDSILTREVAKKPEEQHIYLSTSFWIEIVLLVITAFLIIVIAPLFSSVKDAIPLFPFVALILIFDDLKDLFVAFFRGKEKMELEAFVVVTTNIALSLFGFIVLFFWATPKFFTISNAIASFIGVVVAIFLLRPFIKGIIKNFSKNLIKPIFKSAWPIAIGGFAGSFLFNIDIIMLGWWRGVEDIGFYSAAQKIVGMLAIFSGFIAVATFPSLTRFSHSDKQRARNLLEQSLKMIFIIAIPLVMGGFLLGNSIMVFLFGQSYLPATGAFIILLFSILAVHPLPILSNLLFAFDKQSKMIKYALISSLNNLILNFLLIPNYGMKGAAIATSISFFIYIILLWRAVKKIQEFHILFELFKSFIATLLMGFFTYFLKLLGIHVLVNVIISSVFYFTSLYLLKEKILEEIFIVFKNKSN